MQYEKTKLALRRAIREKCLDCCCGQKGEVRRCNIKKCSLWPYRFVSKKFIDPAIDPAGEVEVEEI